MRHRGCWRRNSASAWSRIRRRYGARHRHCQRRQAWAARGKAWHRRRGRCSGHGHARVRRSHCVGGGVVWPGGDGRDGAATVGRAAGTSRSNAAPQGTLLATAARGGVRATHCLSSRAGIDRMTRGVVVCRLRQVLVTRSRFAQPSAAALAVLCGRVEPKGRASTLPGPRVPLTCGGCTLDTQLVGVWVGCAGACPHNRHAVVNGCGAPLSCRSRPFPSLQELNLCFVQAVSTGSHPTPTAPTARQVEAQAPHPPPPTPQLPLVVPCVNGCPLPHTGPRMVCTGHR